MQPFVAGIFQHLVFSLTHSKDTDGMICRLVLKNVENEERKPSSEVRI